MQVREATNYCSVKSLPEIKEKLVMCLTQSRVLIVHLHTKRHILLAPLKSEQLPPKRLPVSSRLPCATPQKTATFRTTCMSAKCQVLVATIINASMTEKISSSETSVISSTLHREKFHMTAMLTCNSTEVTHSILH
jgi:hypothetical protein